MKCIEKITLHLAKAGKVTVETKNLQVSKNQAAQILCRYYPFKNEGMALVEQSLDCDVFVVSKGEIAITTKLLPQAKVTEAVCGVSRTIESFGFDFEIQELFSNNERKIEFHLYVSKNKSEFSAATSISEALLFEDLHDSKIKTQQKLELVYQKITLSFV